METDHRIDRCIAGMAQTQQAFPKKSNAESYTVQPMYLFQVYPHKFDQVQRDKFLLQNRIAFPYFPN